VEKKKHYSEVLVMANRRKLLETAQDLLNEVDRQFPRPFWEVFSKRCIRSMHLLEPLEVAMVVRALDAHDVQLRGYDVYAVAAPRIRASQQVPGTAVVVLADVLPRRLFLPRDELADLLRHLGRCAADVMWEMAPRHAVAVLDTLSSAGVRDPALSTRVARKLLAQLQSPSEAAPISAQEVTTAAQAFVGQGHRDLDLLQALARLAVEFGSRRTKAPPSRSRCCQHSRSWMLTMRLKN